jgi:hypothetical protein
MVGVEASSQKGNLIVIPCKDLDSIEDCFMTLLRILINIGIDFVCILIECQAIGIHNSHEYFD